MKNKTAFNSAVTALFAAIICAGCFIKIPVGPVPVIIQNALCILTGTILGGFLSVAPTALYIAAGAIGLPVFSGGIGGIAVLLGPTGGFFPGYVLGALAAGLIAGRPSIQQKKLSAVTVLRVSLAMICGMVILYIPGTIRFAQWALANSSVPADSTAFGYTMAACVIPFIPGDILKTVVCIPVALAIRPVLAQYGR